MGAWSGATDGYDEGVDIPDDIPNYGYAGIYHEYRPDGWQGPTGFYRTDFRAWPAPGEIKTWIPLHLWADPELYEDPIMTLSILGDPVYRPPTDWTYTLELLYVPPEIEGAPPVGTTWEVPAEGLFMVDVPTFRTYDGLEGYRFAFSMYAVPEPSAAGGLIAALAWLTVRRRR